MLTLPEGSRNPCYLSFRKPGWRVGSRRKSWVRLVGVNSHLFLGFFQDYCKPTSGDPPGIGKGKSILLVTLEYRSKHQNKEYGY